MSGAEDPGLPVKRSPLPVGLFQSFVSPPQLAVFIQRAKRSVPSGTDTSKI